MLAYEGFASDLGLYAKPGTGRFLTAMVYVPWGNPKQQVLALHFTKETAVHLRMSHGKQITSEEGELQWLYTRAYDAYQELLKTHGIEFHFKAWLSGSLLLPTPNKLIDMEGSLNEDGLMFVVHTISIDPATAGIEMPQGVSWNEWMEELGNSRGFAIQRYVSDRSSLLETRLMGRKRELAEA